MPDSTWCDPTPPSATPHPLAAVEPELARRMNGRQPTTNDLYAHVCPQAGAASADGRPEVPQPSLSD